MIVMKYSVKTGKNHDDFQIIELDVYFHSKRATKGVDVLYQYRVAVHPMGNLELDLTKTQKTT